jgi:Zn-dependent peptidase ImmA (M78 family)/transcriptional regulator with XRE-family HTH domain
VSVDAARAIAPIFDGQRLTLARESNGLLKSDLARLVEVTPAAIGQFESGISKPSAATLAQLSMVLRFPVEFFAFTGERHPRPTIDGTFFRSLRSARQTERQKAVAHAALVWEVVRRIEDLVELPALDLPNDLHVSDKTSLDEIETIAEEVRKRWALNDGPVPHVVRHIELHGIVVTRYLVGSERVDAFSAPFAERPIIVLGDDKGQFDRSRLDAAHELGHLVMHADPQPGDRTLENQAQRFAAAFLLPRDAIFEQLPSGPVNWMQMVTLKRYWGVSVQALLYRARTLGTLDETSYENAMKTMSRRGWRKNEPGYLGPPEQPTLLTKALEALSTTGFNLTDLSALTRLSETTLQTIVGDNRLTQKRLRALDDQP